MPGGRNGFYFILKEKFVSTLYGDRPVLPQDRRVKNCGEVFFPPFQLLVIVDEKSTVNVIHRPIERFATQCKLFCDAVYTSDIIAFCSTLSIAIANSVC